MSKRLTSSLVRFVAPLVGLALLSLDGCSHPNNEGTVGLGGSTGSGVGGNGLGVGGAAGNATGTAGTGVSTGAAGTGAAGTTGSGNAGGAATTGSGGSSTTGTGGSPPASAEMIDNLDDNNGMIIATGGRQGPWHAFNDQNGGNQQPPPGPGFMPQAGGANGTPYAARTTGSGYQFGGVGFGLNNPTSTPESSQSTGYNASPFSGIRFWAKGNGNLRIEFAQRSFVPSDRGGTCSSDCWNVYGSRAIQGQLTADWKQFTVMFSGLQRENGGTSPPFNPSELMTISFKHEGGSFDFWIDEVEFIRGTGSTGSGGTTGGGGSTGSAGQGGTTGAAGRGGTTGTAGRGGTTGAAGQGGTTGSAGTTGQGGTGNVTEPPRIMEGQSGVSRAWASRYWDCCKPACGWKANVSSGNPMASCNQQNMSLGGNYDASSACPSGGQAYMCWSGVPWSVSNTLSYGFAAASGEKYRCGRCYQIQFTGTASRGNAASTGPLNGKTMIIQVINNGGVQSDQFDILIPGGGVGDFNACSTQWGVSSSELGAQYGGFLAGCNRDANCVRQKCQQIFGNKPDLMAGCEWFLGWYNAGDNPDVLTRQIACPQAIIQRSGLSDPG